MGKNRMYSIKYAAMPIINTTSKTDYLEEGKFEEGYIVSKVYLVGEHIIYYAYGKAIKEYEVVFPYSMPLDLTKRNIPNYDINGGYSNIDIVGKVFDTYEEANNEVISLNERLKRRLNNNIVVSGHQVHIKAIDEEFDIRVSNFKFIEDLILLYTEDLKVDTICDNKVLKK